MEARRGEFRRWLDYEGVMDAFTKLFVTMFEEEKWPDDAIAYARTFFGFTSAEDVDTIMSENAQLKEQVATAEARLSELQKYLESLTP